MRSLLLVMCGNCKSFTVWLWFQWWIESRKEDKMAIKIINAHLNCTTSSPSSKSYQYQFDEKHRKILPIKNEKRKKKRSTYDTSHLVFSCYYALLMRYQINLIARKMHYFVGSLFALLDLISKLSSVISGWWEYR